MLTLSQRTGLSVEQLRRIFVFRREETYYGDDEYFQVRLLLKQVTSNGLVDILLNSGNSDLLPLVREIIRDREKESLN